MRDVPSRTALVAVSCVLALAFPAVASAACPGDSGPAPDAVKDRFCGTWNKANEGGQNNLGRPLNNAHRWGSGWIRDFDGGNWGRGGILEADGAGWAFVIAQPWWNTYTAVGGAAGPLGYPRGARVWAGHLHDGPFGPAHNRYMEFQGGVINSWSGGVFATWGEILKKWRSANAVAGFLGRPTSNEGDTARVPGRFSSFEGGVINYNVAKGAAYIVSHGILEKYRALGYSQHALGLPTSDEQHNVVRGNAYQTFDGGAINWYDGKAFETHGRIYSRWVDAGGVNGPLGLPTSDEGNTAIGPHHSTSGRFSSFEHGVINHSRYGTFVVFGGIRERYAEMGYSGSHLGLPTGEEFDWHSGGKRQNFEGGYLYWHPGDDAGHADGDCPIGQGGAPRDVRDRMCLTWSAAGFPNLGRTLNSIHRWGNGWIVDFDGGNWGRGGIMEGDGEGFAYVVGAPYFDALVRAGGAPKIGYPTGRREFGGHLNGPTHRGNRYMTFTGGLVNSSSHGTFATYGAIRARWEAMGHIDGPLRLPLGDEADTARVAGRFQPFEGGNLIYDPATGETAHVYGGILEKYRKLGYSEHPLGLPVADRKSGSRHEYQEFQGGAINQHGGNAYETHGAFHDKWARMGHADGVLGLPTSDRQRNGARGTDFQAFEHGALNEVGGQVFETHGAIHRRWEAAGHAAGALGLPTSDEKDTARSPQGTIGRYNTFEHGVINYNPKVNEAVVLFGAIEDKYASLGFAAGYLGLPTTEEHASDGGRRQNFEGGHIMWRPGWAAALTDKELQAIEQDRPPVTPPKQGENSLPPTPQTPGFRLRAMGDSVTAGFGIYPDGSLMPAKSLLSCRPPERPNNNCTSPEGAAYPAQYARKHRIPDFRNLAVAGSTPEQWIEPGGHFRLQLDAVIASNPDLTVLTLGANPILSDAVNFLGGGVWRCIDSDIYYEDTAPCIEKALNDHQIAARLKRTYTELIRRAPRNHVVVLPYHDTVPLTLSGQGGRVRLALSMLNGAVAEAVASARRDLPNGMATRLRFVPLPSFSDHHCTAQEPWILVNDSCIHPNHLGHEQFSNAIDHIFKDSHAFEARARAVPAASPGTPQIRVVVRVREKSTVYATARPYGVAAAAKRNTPAAVARWTVRARRAGELRLRVPLSASALRKLRRKARGVVVSLVIADAGGNVRRISVNRRF